MPRKPLVRSNFLPYHVTSRANNREPFPISQERMWKVLTDHCFEITQLYGVQIHGLVLMNNHYHLLISTPHDDLGRVMQHFIKSITWTVNLISGRSGRLFGGQYHRSLIDSTTYFSHALKYIYRNPARAGICANVEDYAYSTLQGLMGYRHLELPIHYPFGLSGYYLIPEDSTRFLNWLNRPFQSEHEEAIRAALRKSHFAPSKSGWKRSLEELNNGLL